MSHRPPPSPATPPPARRRPEAVLEREILRRFGQVPDLLLCKNEVAVCFTAAGLDALVVEIQRAFPPIAAEINAIARRVLGKHRITVGLGVGSPDLVGAVGSAGLWVELKAEDGVVSEAQKMWHAAARARGLTIDVVRSEEDMAGAIDRARERARAGGGR